MRRFLAILSVMLAPLLPGLPAQAQALDIEAVFNCAADGPLGIQSTDQCLAARDVLLNNCTSCHTFVPIVKAQKSEDEWTSHLATHRDRVMHISDEDYQLLGDFLRSHYNETEPVPELPPALEALWTNQPA